MPRSKKRSDVLGSSLANGSREDDSKNVKRSRVEESVVPESKSIADAGNDDTAKSEEKMVSSNEDNPTSKGNEIIDLTSLSDTPVQLVQTTIDQYLSTSENPFQQISDLAINSVNFRIRCKIIKRSAIRSFGLGNKVFDGIVCDRSGEIKLVAYKEQVDQFYELISVNKTVIIENGFVKMANENYRTPYSTFEILLMSNTTVRAYNCPNFKPNMMIMKTSLHDVMSINHGTHVDVEGDVIASFDVIVSVSASVGGNIRRKSFKIKEETCIMTITFWNNKIDEIPNDTMNKKIRIRNGRVNHYNDYVSINVSDSSIFEFN